MERINQIVINGKTYDIKDKDLENILTVEDGKLILKDAYGVKELINHKDNKMVIGNTNDDIIIVSKSVKIKIGTNEQNASNLEIMENGDIYMYGIGGYDGTNYSEAQTIQEVINSLISK